MMDFARFAKLLLVAVSLGAALPSSSVAAGPRRTIPRTPQNYQPRELIVKYRSSVARAGRQRALVAAKGGRILKELSSEGLVRVELPAGQSVTDAVAAYRASAEVELAQPNYIYRKSAASTDPRYAQQWFLKNTGQTISSPSYSTANPGTAGRDVGAETAWNTITDCSGVLVAVVDSGVNYTHEELASNMWNGGSSYPNHGWDYVDNDNDPMDYDGHGTHVAGIIGADGNNGRGGAGICWRAQIMAVRVLDATGSGYTSDIVAGINFAVARGARVINLSLGQSANDTALANAITAATNAGAVVVAAAGNDGSNNNTTPVYPCNLPNANLICVAALDQSFGLASFSNYGSTTVDVGAPGTNIWSLGTGTVSSQRDDLSTWVRGSGWARVSLSYGGSPAPALVNPTNWNGTTANYTDNLDTRAYKTFNLGSAVSATMSFLASHKFGTGADSLGIAYRTAAEDPFVSGTLLDRITDSTSGTSVEELSYDLSSCRVANCSLGFQLKTDSSGVGNGAAILQFDINTLTLSTSAYENLSGTSMASPLVAGIVAMVMAQNPSYTASDAVAAVKNSGTSVSALASVTTTGRAVSASAAVGYIAPPTGASASVQ